MSGRFIAAGFRQDIESLFSRFISGDDGDDRPTNETTISATDAGLDVKPDPKVVSLRFSRFCQLWRQMNFSYVFSLRQNVNELREFIDEIFVEVLPNVSDDHRLERRVCALYLLYSLYCKQPKMSDNSSLTSTSKQKIRINFSYLEQIRCLIQTCKELEQMDVCYVWYKMLAIGAVHFVHVSRLMGPLYIRNSRVTSETQTKTDFLIDQFKTSLYPPFDELSHIHEKYRTMKEELTDDTPDLQQLDQIQDNIFELSKAKMDNLVKEFINASTKTSSGLNVSTRMDAEDDSEDSDESNNVSIGEKRRRLRQKAASFGKSAKTACNENNATNSTETASVGPKRGRPKVAKLTDDV
ncbi:uncharacterized protein LOC128956276 [Oppia nitens]|uniref:uncharacterized protein LOC128956276 n=1 Tax=Oppia nitens TaxID=1686743 RepID=UPI0023DCAFF7|nr:uncharacterized protein LOC128956276 [Oppia nitens]